MNPASYQVVAHFYMAEGTLTYPHPMFMNFQFFVLLTHYLYICLTTVSLFTLFDTNANKINNPQPCWLPGILNA